MSINKIIVVLFIVTLFIVSFFAFQDNEVESKNFPITHVSITDCNPQGMRCRVELQDVTFEISLNKNIYYLKPFNVSVISNINNNSQIRDIHISFKMKNMNMGVNHFKLIKADTENKKQHWENKALLPICVTRRADWIAKLEVIMDKSSYVMLFPILVQKVAL